MLRSFARTGHWDGIEAARSNYHTLTGHRVLKVNFHNKRATGVSFVPTDATSAANALTVTAKKEVILAAGTIHTPKILQASGIGAKALLQAASIPKVVDLPGVGANLQDHPFQVGPSFLRKPPLYEVPSPLPLCRIRYSFFSKTPASKQLPLLPRSQSLLHQRHLHSRSPS